MPFFSAFVNTKGSDVEVMVRAEVYHVTCIEINTHLTECIFFTDLKLLFKRSII